MSRRFLNALQRRDLSGIRRALFLEPLLMRNSGAQLEQGRDGAGEASGGGADGAAESVSEDGAGPEARAPMPSDEMMLPTPPPPASHSTPNPA
jgi:hypothetical protein